jgi:hypothetical protein
MGNQYDDMEAIRKNRMKAEKQEPENLSHRSAMNFADANFFRATLSGKGSVVPVKCLYSALF